MCPSVELLDEILENQELKEKVLIFDHHKFSMDRIEKEYPFLIETEQKNNQKCCGTSLFYEYLLDTNTSSTLKKGFVRTFVELTRLHDTYEWREKNNQEAYHLQIMYQFLGPWGYMYHFIKRMEQEENFSYLKEEKEWINYQIESNQKRIEELYQNIVLKEQKGVLFGIFITNYEYRNLLADYIKNIIQI